MVCRQNWEEKGSAAYKRAKAAANNSNNVEISAKDLDAAFPFPIVFIIGWVLFALSYLFPTSGGFSPEFKPASIAAIVFSLALAGVASVQMGDAVRYRKPKKKMRLSLLFMLSWIGLTVASGFSTGNGIVSFILSGLGMVCIILFNFSHQT